MISRWKSDHTPTEFVGEFYLKPKINYKSCIKWTYEWDFIRFLSAARVTNRASIDSYRLERTLKLSFDHVNFHLFYEIKHKVLKLSRIFNQEVSLGNNDVHSAPFDTEVSQTTTRNRGILRHFAKFNASQAVRNHPNTSATHEPSTASESHHRLAADDSYDQGRVANCLEIKEGSAVPIGYWEIHPQKKQMDIPEPNSPVENCKNVPASKHEKSAKYSAPIQHRKPSSFHVFVDSTVPPKRGRPRKNSPQSKNENPLPKPKHPMDQHLFNFRVNLRKASNSSQVNDAKSMESPTSNLNTLNHSESLINPVKSQETNHEIQLEPRFPPSTLSEIKANSMKSLECPIESFTTDPLAEVREQVDHSDSKLNIITPINTSGSSLELADTKSGALESTEPNSQKPSKSKWLEIVMN